MTIKVTFLVDTPEEAVEILNRASGNVNTPVPVEAAGAPQAEPASTAGTGIVDPPEAPPASAAVRELLNQYSLTGEEIVGTGKAGRLTKADVTAFIKANTPPAEPEVDPFALDDEPPAPVVVAATKENVRTAMIGYQSALKEKLVAAGNGKEAAQTDAMNQARALLAKAGGATTLGGLDEAKYGDVVAQATAATAAL